MTDKATLIGPKAEVEASYVPPVQNHKNEPARSEAVQNDTNTPVVTDKGQMPASEADSSAVVNNNSNVHLRFRYDEDTKKMTVFIVDRSTRQVIRTIPPDEVNRLSSGDLVELLS
jgi:uncharacterized FlaG/YvyC family protein